MVGLALVKIRKQLGFDSARSFFFKFLKVRANIACTYIYYTKIEAESALPSSELVESMVSAMADAELSKFLIYSYCQDLFPTKKDFFKIEFAGGKKSAEVRKESGQRTIQKQKSLTHQQIHAITQSEDHYLIFTIITLARHPVAIDELENKYGLTDVKKIIADLTEGGILHMVNHQIVSSSKEMVFPKDVPPEILKKYALVDIWSTHMGARLKLKTSYDKMMIRRISDRYKDLIYNHIDLLLNLVRAADETDQTMNDQVVQLSLVLRDGKVSG